MSRVNRRGAESKASKKRRRQRKELRALLEANAIDFGVCPIAGESYWDLRARLREAMAGPFISTDAAGTWVNSRGPY